MRFTPALLLIVLNFLAACGQSTDEDDPAQTQDLVVTENQYRTASLSVGDSITLPNTLSYTLNRAGDGKSPAADSIVTFHYRGMLEDGKVFDSSYDYGEPFTAPMDKLFTGWRQMLLLMRVGDMVRVTFPPSLGFGDREQGDLIPPNTTLTFDMELLDVSTQDDKNAEALAPNTEFNAEYAAGEGVTTTESGLMYKVIQSTGGSEKPAPTDFVTVHYKGSTIDGVEFDSSYNRGEPIEFPLNGVIPGWSEGVQLMSVGDIYEFAIPYDLGYGERGIPGAIPPFATLVFQVELLDMETAEARTKREAEALEAVLQEQKSYLEDNAKQEGVTVTDSGLQIRWITKSEEGDSPTPNSDVTVHYVGTLMNGEEFDSSRRRGQPATFPVMGVIPGWTEALQLMKVGDKVELLLPHGIAYGERGTPNIPPYSALRFEVELLDVQD